MLNIIFPVNIEVLRMAEFFGVGATILQTTEIPHVVTNRHSHIAQIWSSDAVINSTSIVESTLQHGSRINFLRLWLFIKMALCQIGQQ